MGLLALSLLGCAPIELEGGAVDESLELDAETEAAIAQSAGPRGVLSSTVQFAPNGDAFLAGWACSVGTSKPVEVDLFTASKRKLGTVIADLPVSKSEVAAIQRLCATSSAEPKVRFRLKLSRGQRLDFPGEAVTASVQGQVLAGAAPWVPGVNPKVTVRAGQPWFAPLPPSTANCRHDAVDAGTFMPLFPRPEASLEWAQAAGRVSVFKFFGAWMADRLPPVVDGGTWSPGAPTAASDAQLTQAVDFLRRQQLAMAVEVPALKDPTKPWDAWKTKCGLGSDRLAYLVDRLSPIVAAVNRSDVGGRQVALDYIALDEPFSHAALVTDPGNVNPSTNQAEKCLSIEETAQHVAYTVKRYRASFPSVRVGLTEFVWNVAIPAKVYVEVLESYRAAVGEWPSFFHVDTSYTPGMSPALMGLQRELQAFCAARGIKFGMIYICARGPVSDQSCPPVSEPNPATSDLQCATQMLERARAYEAAAPTRPDHALFQSWFTYPRTYVPETKLGSFTNTLVRYPLARTVSIEAKSRPRTTVSCQELLEAFRGRKVGTFLALGQSNSSNNGAVHTISKRAVYEMVGDRCFEARDPTIDASGLGGSTWPRLGDLLVDAGVYDLVIFKSIGVGGTSVKQWAEVNGPLAEKARAAIANFKAQSLPLKHILWHQGESDAATAEQTYVDQFLQVVRILRAAGAEAPVYVSKATLLNGRTDGETQRAQERLQTQYVQHCVGPNTDTLTGTYRKSDNTHFSEIGLAAASQQWFDAIVAGRCVSK